MPAKVEQKNGTDGRRRNRKNGKENFLLLKILGKLKDEASSLISPPLLPFLTYSREGKKAPSPLICRKAKRVFSVSEKWVKEDGKRNSVSREGEEK